MFGLYERCLKDARLVSLHTIHGTYRTIKGLNLPCLHEYRNVFDEIFIPVTQMLPRNPLYSFKSNVALFKRNIYRAQYAFATLKKLCFGVAPACLPRKQYSAPGAGYQLRLLCNRASRSANTLLISCCPSIFFNTLFTS